MSRWTGAAARLNRAADSFYGELISVLRPAASSAYVKGEGAPTLILQLAGVVSEGEDQGVADGETPGTRTFHRNLSAGAIEASFMRTGFASPDQWPRQGDLLRIDTGPRTGAVFEAQTAASDDGDRVNVPVIRRS
ncbi:hypothetical protein [Phenylobacterium sp.]|uniref:hypothetical protein n=1 Tax=Phenylobacterium sp. TaxID=1871053 RepID=UPI00272F41FC|nr:hypothetical protein [Phenylobacterium sp.]MDP2214767.1 hypothetical protein [Phenylobacterium sp.]